MFICDDWLAVNKSDGNIRRTLKPSNAFTAANNASALVRSNMFHKAVDGHMWLSVGMRAKPSSFTRAQRLATCMATLFLAMITNCMFFRTADEQTLNSEAISLGPITLTPQQISNSLFSSLIVFPPVLIMVYFFSKSVPKYERREDYEDDDTKRRTPCNPLLPYWCIYSTILVHLHHHTGASTAPYWCIYSTILVHLQHHTGAFTLPYWCIYITILVHLQHHTGAFTSPYWCIHITILVHLHHHTGASTAPYWCIHITILVHLHHHTGATTAPYWCIYSTILVHLHCLVPRCSVHSCLCILHNPLQFRVGS